MAILTNAEYGQLRAAIYRRGAGKEELKALAALPSKAKLLAVFQAIEDNSQASRAAIKSAIDAALGFATSAALARKLYAAYVAVKGA